MEQTVDKNIDIETKEDVENIINGLNDVKNGDVMSIESEQEISLILERLKEAESGKVMSLEESIEKFVEEKKIWKRLIFQLL